MLLTLFFFNENQLNKPSRNLSVIGSFNIDRSNIFEK